MKKRLTKREFNAIVRAADKRQKAIGDRLDAIEAENENIETALEAIDAALENVANRWVYVRKAGALYDAMYGQIKKMDKEQTRLHNESDRLRRKIERLAKGR